MSKEEKLSQFQAEIQSHIEAIENIVHDQMLADVVTSHESQRVGFLSGLAGLRMLVNRTTEDDLNDNEMTRPSGVNRIFIYITEGHVKQIVAEQPDAIEVTLIDDDVDPTLDDCPLMVSHRGGFNFEANVVDVTVERTQDSVLNLLSMTESDL